MARYNMMQKATLREAEGPLLLGRFEYSLMRAIEILGTNAYGAQIGRYLSEKLHRDVTPPQVYITLERLAKRGLVRSENTDPVPARGGRGTQRVIIEAERVRGLRAITVLCYDSSDF